MLSLRKILMFVGNSFKQDYLVEQGTSDGWTYRKWNSGFVECYRRHVEVVARYSSTGAPMSNLFYKKIYLPFTLAEKPIYTFTVSTGSGIAVPFFGVADTTEYITPYWSSNVTGESRLNIHLVGRWK